MYFWNKGPIKHYILNLVKTFGFAFVIWSFMFVPSAMMADSGSIESANGAVFFMFYSFVGPFVIGYIFTIYDYIRDAKRESEEDVGLMRNVIAVLMTVSMLSGVGGVTVMAANQYQTPNVEKNEINLSKFEVYSQKKKFYQRVADKEEDINQAIKDSRRYVGLGNVNVLDDNNGGLELHISNTDYTFDYSINKISMSQRGYIDLITDKGYELQNVFSKVVYGKIHTDLNSNIISKELDHSLVSLKQLNNGGGK